jgi:hypothetical protein
MSELKKNWKGIYEKICWAPGPRLIKKIIYRAVVSQTLGNTGVVHCIVVNIRILLVIQYILVNKMLVMASFG